MTAACKLARAGLDVHVVEAGATFGGQSTAFALVESAPNHRISPYAVDDIFLTAGGLVDELELRRFGHRDIYVDPSYVYLHPDGATLSDSLGRRRGRGRGHGRLVIPSASVALIAVPIGAVPRRALLLTSKSHIPHRSGLPGKRTAQIESM